MIWQVKYTARWYGDRLTKIHCETEIEGTEQEVAEKAAHQVLAFARRHTADQGASYSYYLDCPICGHARPGDCNCTLEYDSVCFQQGGSWWQVDSDGVNFELYQGWGEDSHPVDIAKETEPVLRGYIKRCMAYLKKEMAE